MALHLKNLSPRRIVKTARAYKASREGLAAIEFAFVAPIMIVMYLGLAELSLLIAEDRRVSHAANVAGDLTTQQASVTKAQMSNIMNAVLLTLEIPENDITERNKVKIEITSYNLDPTTNAPASIGQATLGGAFGDTYNASNIDSRLLNATSGVVVARVSYDYQFSLMNYDDQSSGASPLSRSSKSVTLDDTFLLKPRASAQVTFDAGTSGGSTTYNCSFSAGKPSC